MRVCVCVCVSVCLCGCSCLYNQSHSFRAWTRPISVTGHPVTAYQAGRMQKSKEFLETCLQQDTQQHKHTHRGTEVMVNAHWGLYPKVPFPLPFAGSARLHALFAYGGHEACQIVVNYFYYNFPFVFALCDFFTVTPSAHTLRTPPTL